MYYWIVLKTNKQFYLKKAIFIRKMQNIIYDNEVIYQNNLNGKINVSYIKTDDLENNITNSNNNEQDGRVIINNNDITISKDENSTFKALDGNISLWLHMFIIKLIKKLINYLINL